MLSSMEAKSLKDIYPRRKSLRLSGYDYSQQGVYFVTLYIHGKLCLFGQIIDSSMRLNQYGKMATSVWHEIPLHYPDINNKYIHRGYFGAAEPPVRCMLRHSGSF
jgi:hypothetical protein